MYVFELLDYHFVAYSLEEIIDFFNLGKYKNLVFDSDTEFLYGSIFRVIRTKHGVSKDYCYSYRFFIKQETFFIDSAFPF